MSTYSFLLCALLGFACATPSKVEPRILSTVKAEDRYLIRVNFLLLEEELIANPEIAVGFETALREWSRQLPIECSVVIEKHSQFAFSPFGVASVSDQQEIIEVRIVDTTLPPYYGDAGTLGFWNHRTGVLGLDKNLLRGDVAKSYSVSLHELGHLFGLKHFVNKMDPAALTGYIIPVGVDAESMVMFPYISKHYLQSKLSELEISLAKKNVLGLGRFVNSECFDLTVDRTCYRMMTP